MMFCVQTGWDEAIEGLCGNALQENDDGDLRVFYFTGSWVVLCSCWGSYRAIMGIYSVMHFLAPAPRKIDKSELLEFWFRRKGSFAITLVSRERRNRQHGNYSTGAYIHCNITRDTESMPKSVRCLAYRHPAGYAILYMGK